MPSSLSQDAAAALYELTNSLRPVRRAWVKAASTVIADFDLSTTVATTIILVSRQADHGIQQNVLAEEVGVNPGAMVRILDQAENAELLVRLEVPGDRRAKAVQILPKGRQAAKKMEGAIAKLRMSLLSDVTKEELETVTRVLRLFESRAAAFLQQAQARR
jgi:MarR family transcriptional regulator for hemolysin